MPKVFSVYPTSYQILLQGKMEAKSRSSSAPVLPLPFSLHTSHSPTRHFNSPSSSSTFSYQTLLQGKMETRSRSSSAPVLPLPFSLHTSHSPTRHFNSPSSSSTFSFAVHRTLSSTNASFCGDSSYSSSASTATSSSIKHGLDRSASQVQTTRLPISPKDGAALKHIPCAPPRKTCMCSPTNHPGSFSCSLHRNSNNPSSYTMHSHLNAKRSAMTNSLVRIGGVGERVRRALTALIRPSSHHTRRRTIFSRGPAGSAI